MAYADSLTVLQDTIRTKLSTGGGGSSIDDDAVASTTTWSSSKIDASMSYVLDEITETVNEISGVVFDATGRASVDLSVFIDDLTASATSLWSAQRIAAAISDSVAAIIDDGEQLSETATWSSFRIYNEIQAIIEATNNLRIKDLDVRTDTLWSSKKIFDELALKANTVDVDSLEIIPAHFNHGYF